MPYDRLQQKYAWPQKGYHGSANAQGASALFICTIAGCRLESDMLPSPPPAFQVSKLRAQSHICKGRTSYFFTWQSRLESPDGQSPIVAEPQSAPLAPQ